MRLINLVSALDLEGEMLDADVVVAVGATVGWTQAETTVTDRSWSRKVHDLLRAPVGRIPDLLGPSERPEQVEVEGERPLNVGDREIDVVYSRALASPVQAMTSGDGRLQTEERRSRERAAFFQ